MQRRSAIVIVGAAGFLGQACTRALTARGREVLGVDIAPDPGAGATEWLLADVMIHGVPDDLLDRADVIVHLAWRNDPGRGNADMASDVIGNVANTVRCFEAAGRAGVRRIVYASSGGTIYGNAAVPTPETASIAPIGGYGAGKAAAELYLRAVHHAYGIGTCALRIANPYGPGQYPNRGQGFIATAIARTLARQPIQIFGDIGLARDYVYVDDVAAAVALACLTEDAGDSIFNVGSARSLSLSDLLPMIFAAVGHDTAVEQVPRRAMDVARMELDTARIEAALRWRAETTIEEGLSRTVDWLRASVVR